MKIVVAGAAGMLGRDVVAAARHAGDTVVALDRAALDVLDRPAVMRTIAELRPDAVVNCAAWTDVDGAEDDETGATALNGDAAGYLAEAAASVGAAIVYPSTDYVFDGDKRDPYVESDPVAPVTAYGRSKLAGEIATADANPRHFIVRTAWLFGANGRNFVDTMLRLADERDELRVVADQIGCPTYTVHLASAIVALAESRAYGIHHVAGGGQCSWHRLALETFRMSDATVTAEPCTTDEFPRPAARPAYSVLRTENKTTPTLPPWRVGLAAYLAETQRHAEVAA